MSFIDTPAALSSSTSANSCLQGKQPAVPRYTQTLSTFKALDLFADDETAQKICLYFEDPDTILAIDDLAKVSRAHQQEEQEIRLARLRFCLPPPLPRDLLSLRLYLNDLQKQQLVNEARPMLHTFAPNAPSSSAFTATNTHPDIPSETAATTQTTSNTLTPIMEELTRIFSTMPESRTPQANHTETNELIEKMGFTPSET
ncbi:hypothetical protein CVT25_003933 [Psilocybe cyanescens]|uniref:Uncharacterized protein n=1 Tax=Psilocybe cyanescens TaxID=93625 RepID=A0A409XW41_PSICY|nr:hypothetical protein CVT25_003933 [Psilocybe cyanescens]